MKNKTIFTINVHSFVDVITNSSAELFTSLSDSKEELIELIKEAYPHYLDEYEEVRAMSDLSLDEYDNFLSYAYVNWNDELSLSKKFNIEPSILYSNWDEKGTKNWWYGHLSTEGRDLITKQIDPEGKMFFLYSIDENPDWDNQEKLMAIMTRYHLG